jgi:4-amino-4-deoxy-L-arabinose transferase-like glycosyltransferase
MTSVDTGPLPRIGGEPTPGHDFPQPDQSSPAAEATPVAAGLTGRERGMLGALLGATALLYLWGLGASGWANEFYAAAVQAGTTSWKAMFFGSFDSSNFITVDKPPASLWPMEISARIFGFNSWAMLVPQAIEGVLTVWLLHATVRRWFGHWAGLLAGALLAMTPVAVLMFRFNNPDALMTLLIVAAAYCTVRAIEVASLRWLALAGLVMGFAFLAKGLQPFTVLPALALGYLVAAPTTLRTRLLHLLASGLGVIVGAGWWVLVVDLTPAASRPYIGGSGDNTALGLAFGYNGLSRITGDSAAGPGGGGGANFSGSTGLGRLFNSLNGGQISWLLPTALVAMLAMAAATERRPRTDRTSAAMIIWGGWLLVTGGVLSFAGGIIHTYYSVEIAPAVAAVVAIGAVELWRRRDTIAARIGLAAGALVTGIWGYTLLHRSASWHPWISYLLIAVAGAAAALLLVPASMVRRGLAVTTLAAGVVTLGGGSAAYALQTAATPHTGSVPSAGPAVSSTFARPGGFGGNRRFGSPPGGFPIGGFPGRPEAGGALPGGATFPGGGTFPGAPNGTRGAAGGLGGFGGGTTSSALTALLKNTTTTWAAATVGSMSAGPLELASGKAVMAIGGFSGSDPAPTLARFTAYVKAGRIRYFIGSGAGGGGGPGGRGSGGASEIASWVSSHYTAQSVGGQTVYDLAAPSR